MTRPGRDDYMDSVAAADLPFYMSSRKGRLLLLQTAAALLGANGQTGQWLPDYNARRKAIDTARMLICEVNDYAFENARKMDDD